MPALAQVEEERAFRDEIERDPGKKHILALKILDAQNKPISTPYLGSRIEINPAAM